MKLVIVESPYRGATDEETEANVIYACACVRDSLLRGESPIASHILYTQAGILDDKVPSERQHGIDAGLAWGSVAHMTAVYVDRGISHGMQYGIANAGRAGRSVEYRRLQD